MTPRDENTRIDLTENQSEPVAAATETAPESEELTAVHELEERIAPLCRKAGGTPIEY